MTTLQDKVFAVLLTLIAVAFLFGFIAILSSALSFEAKAFILVFSMPIAFMGLVMLSLKLTDLIEASNKL